MALGHSPSIVTRNILLNLDFGNIQKCYNGSENLKTNSATSFFPVVGSWTSTATSTDITAPDGSSTTYKVVSNGSGQCSIDIGYLQINLTAGVTYTISAYYYATHSTNAGRTIGIAMFGNSNSGTAPIVLPQNQWVRQSLTFTATNTYASGQMRMISNDTGGLTTTNGATVYLWGAQVERGYTASPYVATVASTVTRPTTATSTISNYSHTINQPQYISYDGTNNSIRFDRNETFANFTGSITSNVLTVTAMSGITTITNGSALSYSGLTPTRYITSFGTGIGTTGTYNVNAGIDTTSRTMTSAYKIGGNMNVSTSGSLASNTYLYNDHTTEVWARINDINAASYDAYEAWSVLAVYSGYHSMFIYTPSIGLRYDIWGPSNTSTSALTLGTSATDIIQGQWFNVAVTKSGTTFKTYLNGVLKKTDTITSTAFVGVSNTLALGSAYDGNTGAFYYYAKNNVGCLKMYNATLSADEISQNFNALRGRYVI
jgi:hypothetical protein